MDPSASNKRQKVEDGLSNEMSSTSSSSSSSSSPSSASTAPTSISSSEAFMDARFAHSAANASESSTSSDDSSSTPGAGSSNGLKGAPTPPKVPPFNAPPPKARGAANAAVKQDSSSSSSSSSSSAASRTSSDVRFAIITNDGSPENMERLVTLKNIFGKQLPKMPKEYIVRLVMDRRHFSMALLRNGTAIGGICYRPYMNQHFAEIAFCAITASEQVKGFGTKLMNHVKQHVKRLGITHFLTYADNYAIGYFKKQGFSKTLYLPRERWYGYIKDYDGGTLMECYIHPTIDFTAVPAMVKAQRAFVLARIKELSHEDVVRDGLDRLAAAGAGGAEGGSAANGTAEGAAPVAAAVGRLETKLSGASSVASKVGIEEIPGVLDAGWTQANYLGSAGRDADREYSAMVGSLQQLWKDVQKHSSSWPFREPVDLEEVPDYLNVIKDPLDLSTIKGRLDSGYYKSREMLRADMNRMISNCKVYNDKSTIFYREADALGTFVERIFSRH